MTVVSRPSSSARKSGIPPKIAAQFARTWAWCELARGVGGLFAVVVTVKQLDYRVQVMRVHRLDESIYFLGDPDLLVGQPAQKPRFSFVACPPSHHHRSQAAGVGGGTGHAA